MWVKTTDIPSLPCWLYCYRRHLFIYGSPWESSPCQVPVSSYSLLSQFKNSKVLLERGRDDERGGVRWVQSRDSVIAIKITLHMGRCRVNTTAKKKKDFCLSDNWRFVPDKKQNRHDSKRTASLHNHRDFCYRHPARIRAPVCLWLWFNKLRSQYTRC